MPTVIPYAPARYCKDALTPEVVDPRIADVEALARWLDYSFELPGGFQFGFAGIIGLIPGIGDLFDALISLYIVGRAIQLGIPRVALVRMVVNVGIEVVLGTIPLFGDGFDILSRLLCAIIENGKAKKKATNNLFFFNGIVVLKHSESLLGIKVFNLFWRKCGDY